MGKLNDAEKIKLIADAVTNLYPWPSYMYKEQERVMFHTMYGCFCDIIDDIIQKDDFPKDLRHYSEIFKIMQIPLFYIGVRTGIERVVNGTR